MSKRAIGIPAVLALTALLAACGGGDGAPTAPTAGGPAPPPAPVTTVATQGTVGGVEPHSGFSTLPFKTSAPGKLDVTVDWTFAKNNVDVYVVMGETHCTAALFNARECDFAAFSEGATAKPERISVPSLAAGTYTLLIINWGPDPESLSYEALLTTGLAASASTARVPSQPTTPGTLERIVGR